MHTFKTTFYRPAKGQSIWKANCQTVDSPKKGTNKFFDLKGCYLQGQSTQTGFFELALRDRNIQV